MILLLIEINITVIIIKHTAYLSLDMYEQNSLQENVIIMQQRRFPEISAPVLAPLGVFDAERVKPGG